MSTSSSVHTNGNVSHSVLDALLSATPDSERVISLDSAQSRPDVDSQADPFDNRPLTCTREEAIAEIVGVYHAQEEASELFMKDSTVRFFQAGRRIAHVNHLFVRSTVRNVPTSDALEASRQRIKNALKDNYLEQILLRKGKLVNKPIDVSKAEKIWACCVLSEHCRRLGKSHLEILMGLVTINYEGIYPVPHCKDGKQNLFAKLARKADEMGWSLAQLKKEMADGLEKIKNMGKTAEEITDETLRKMREKQGKEFTKRLQVTAEEFDKGQLDDLLLHLLANKPERAEKLLAIMGRAETFRNQQMTDNDD